ncbi:MAG: plastocyanin/azurin family copper-binding protein [Caldilineaceae bacterium]
MLIDPEGVVFNVLDGNLITDANVACMEATASAAEDGSINTVFALWDAETYGQINPQMTAADGYFSFMTPAGTYRIVVNKAGYQPHTSPDLAVVSDAVRYDVPLTPIIAEAAGAQVSIGANGFEPAVLTVEPGTIIEWINVDVDAHSASSEKSVNAAGLNINGIVFDSGLLGSGESYKFQLTTAGTYTVFDRANPANSATVVVEAAGVSQPLDNAVFLPVVLR